MSKLLEGGRLSRRRQAASIRPYHMRVSRELGGGLWQIEDENGQLYLAVLSLPSSAAVRDLHERRRADGSAYRSRTSKYGKASPRAS